jgi:NADH:ubiquinone oxidoreductase subunit 3 (subunit A)
MHIKVSQLGSLLTVALLLLCLTILSAQAAPTLKLSFYKNNGYSLGNDMQGQWTINTEVSSDVIHVEFYIDDQLQFNDTQAPFSWPFNTEDYELGLHTLKVLAYDSAGEYAIEERQPNFVGFPLMFIVGIISLVVVGVIAAFVFALYRARRNEAKERQQNFKNN